MAGKYRRRGISIVQVSLRLEEPTYKKLLKLKIIENKGITFNKYLNGILAQHVVNNRGMLGDRSKVDWSEFE